MGRLPLSISVRCSSAWRFDVHSGLSCPSLDLSSVRDPASRVDEGHHNSPAPTLGSSSISSRHRLLSSWRRCPRSLRRRGGSGPRLPRNFATGSSRGSVLAALIFDSPHPESRPICPDRRPRLATPWRIEPCRRVQITRPHGALSSREQASPLVDPFSPSAADTGTPGKASAIESGSVLVDRCESRRPGMCRIQGFRGFAELIAREGTRRGGMHQRLAPRPT